MGSVTLVRRIMIGRAAKFDTCSPINSSGQELGGEVAVVSTQVA